VVAARFDENDDMSSNNATVRRLVLADAADYFELRREALEREPYAFGSAPSDDRFRLIEPVREALTDSDQAIIGAFAPALIGAVGVRRLTRIKLRHRAELWGMYVRPEHRRVGIGRRLVEEAIRFAREGDGIRQLHLAVTDRAGGAAELYEKLGFVVWGIEPAGLRVDGIELAEKHMVLRL
jgi:ribosomal protein S18 acetylase RimI-like enzyme